MKERERERERERGLFKVIGDNHKHNAKNVSKFTVYKTTENLVFTGFMLLILKFIMVTNVTFFTPNVV